MSIVSHKKSEPAGSRVLAFHGHCQSYWAEDGWHGTETMMVVPAPLPLEGAQDVNDSQ